MTLTSGGGKGGGRFAALFEWEAPNIDTPSRPASSQPGPRSNSVDDEEAKKNDRSFDI